MAHLVRADLPPDPLAASVPLLGNAPLAAIEVLESQVQHGIVLRAHPCHEADLIVTLLTATAGKLTAIARNAKRSKKRFLGGIDYFDCGKFIIKERRTGDISFSLEELSEKEPWTGLRQAILNFSCASFCIEVVDYLTVEGDEESSDLFKPLYLTLRTIAKTTDVAQIYSLVVYLSLQVLVHSGYDPSSLGAEEELPAELKLWFKEIMRMNQAIVPNSKQTLKLGIDFIIPYLERITEKSFKSDIVIGHDFSR